MGGSYSIPIEVAPRLAAEMTVMPSPEPRSMWKSFGVSLAMSSMRSTNACGEGTHTTSLPDWPTRGSKGAAGLPVCADVQVATESKRAVRMAAERTCVRIEGAFYTSREPS